MDICYDREVLCFHVFLVLLFRSLACGIPERPKTITISKVTASRPLEPEDIQSIEQAMAAIITVTRDDLDLPVVDPLYVYLYKNSVSFAYYGHGWNTLPFDVANKAAFAQDNKINVDLQKTPKKPLGFVRVLAHEYAHNIQYSIAGMEPRTSRWINEGFADWVAARVLHFLKWQDYAVTLHAVNQELVTNKEILPEISLLHNYWRWDRMLSQPNGLVKTHRLAFVAVDRLIQQKGLTAVIQYFRSADFERSFEMSRKDFEADFGKYLSALKAQGAFIGNEDLP